jgi:hypothetical protein
MFPAGECFAIGVWRGVTAGAGKSRVYILEFRVRTTLQGAEKSGFLATYRLGMSFNFFRSLFSRSDEFDS